MKKHGRKKKRREEKRRKKQRKTKNRRTNKRRRRAIHCFYDHPSWRLPTPFPLRNISPPRTPFHHLPSLLPATRHRWSACYRAPPPDRRLSQTAACFSRYNTTVAPASPVTRSQCRVPYPSKLPSRQRPPAAAAPYLSYLPCTIPHASFSQRLLPLVPTQPPPVSVPPRTAGRPSYLIFNFGGFKGI